MKVSKAMELLARVMTKHGDVDVFFDCPHCQTAFTPDVLSTAAVHLSAVPPTLPQEPKE